MTWQGRNGVRLFIRHGNDFTARFPLAVPQGQAGKTSARRASRQCGPSSMAEKEKPRRTRRRAYLYFEDEGEDDSGPSAGCRVITVVRRRTSAAALITDRVQRMAKDLFQLRRAHSQIGAALLSRPKWSQYARDPSRSVVLAGVNIESSVCMRPQSSLRREALA
jgi:hypothetical protein